MNIEAEEVRKVAFDQSVDFSEWGTMAAATFYEDLRSNYSPAEGPLRPLWEGLEHCRVVQDADGWAYLPQYFEDEPVLLVLEESPVSVFRFESASDLVTVLSNSFGFPFYVTNTSITALVAFNDHDVLIACGDAASRTHIRTSAAPTI